MSWRLILEEYGPVLNYIKGEKNIVADALSCIGMSKQPIVDELPKEESACLYAVDEVGLEFPLHYPLSFREIQYRQGKDAAL